MKNKLYHNNYDIGHTVFININDLDMHYICVCDDKTRLRPDTDKMDNLIEIIDYVD